MSVIEMIQYLSTFSSCSNLVKGVFQCTCPVIIHAHGVPKQRSLGLEVIEADKKRRWRLRKSSIWG
jgi:hypothetical protein